MINPIKTSFRLPLLVFALAVGGILAGCQSTQKTEGVGMVSVVAQNVVRIAGRKAINDLKLEGMKDQRFTLKLTGFVEDRTRGFIDNLVSSQVEAAGGRLVPQGNVDRVVEVVVSGAGNDQGQSRIPIINKALRTEAVIDLTIIIRDAQTGRRLSEQKIKGEAKYEQKEWLGVFDESGKYYVKDRAGDYVEIKNLDAWR